MLIPVLHRRSLSYNEFDDLAMQVLSESRSGALASRIPVFVGTGFPGLRSGVRGLRRSRNGRCRSGRRARLFLEKRCLSVVFTDSQAPGRRPRTRRRLSGTNVIHCPT